MKVLLFHKECAKINKFMDVFICYLIFFSIKREKEKITRKKEHRLKLAYRMHNSSQKHTQTDKV